MVIRNEAKITRNSSCLQNEYETHSLNNTDYSNLNVYIYSICYVHARAACIRDSTRLFVARRKLAN